MTTFRAPVIARGRVNGELHLLEADGELLTLQHACGGTVGGPLAIPELRELARKAFDHGMKLSRPFSAFQDDTSVEGFVDLDPLRDGGETCELALTSLSRRSRAEGHDDPDRKSRDIAKAVAECRLTVDQAQRVMSVDNMAADLALFVEELSPGTLWTDAIPELAHDADWRMLDGTVVTIEGSDRRWSVIVEPLTGTAGFAISLASDQIPPSESALSGTAKSSIPALGSDLSPILRQPINRIIANAETIRTRLAGPLADEYANYAADIATAGQHLLSLLDDLADLEVVESDDFLTAPDRIDLGDVARQACGILGVRARERGIVLVPPPAGEAQLAIAESRRVLQILLNLVNNAIRYTPEGSQVWVRLDRIGQRAMITVADQGHGISEEEQAKVFTKFERLGRSGDGGSGLGLYISRKIARAMDGDLTVESAPGQGARFTLSVPATDDLRNEPRD